MLHPINTTTERNTTMRTKGQTRPYVLTELQIKLHAASGEAVDTAITYDVGVVVTFDYDFADEDDAAQAHIRSVTSAGAALEGENTTVNLWMGRELLPYLPQPEIDAIAEAMVEHMAKVIADENEAMQLHRAGL